MICASCGGNVLWMGPLSNLTHTECQSCGAINNQVADWLVDQREEDGEDPSLSQPKEPQS